VRAPLLGLLAGLLLVLGALGFLYHRHSSGGQPVAASIEANVSQSRPLPGQLVSISGEVQPQGRPVTFQIRDAEKWVEKSSATAGEAGAFSFSVAATETPTVYRVFAPAAKIDKKKHAAVRSKRITLTAAKAAGSLTLGAPIGQSPAGDAGLSPGTATFSPAREGSPVEIQRESSGTWTTVASGKQDKDGRFAFVVDPGPPKSPYTLRARTELPDASPITSGTATSDWRLAWSDEFDGTEVGADWKIRSAGGPAAKRACATVDENRTSVHDGNLELSVLTDPKRIPNVTGDCPHGQFLNAMVGTQESRAFQYGMFAARIKYPPPRGEHGSFWMQPGGPAAAATAAAATAPPGNGGAEIDVSEYFGDGYREGGLASFVYHQGAKIGGLTPKTVGILGAGNTPSEGFHIYSVEWTPEEYIFRLDGVETLRVTQGVSQTPQYVILSLLTSDWELPKLPKSELPTTMKVDWVRVWQQ
jgi:beta-glucanase (GH16 family)